MREILDETIAQKLAWAIMQSTCQQFRDLPDSADPIDFFERLFRTALEKLLPDLAASPWYVREHDVVNLFVFHHLIPQFQDANLDICQIAIEQGVQQVPGTAKGPHGKYADIVVWPHNKATTWGACKPLAHIEWKNISCREKNPGKLKQKHAQDVEGLIRDRQYASASYAVLTEWHPFPHEQHKGQNDCHVEVHCKRASDAGNAEDFFWLKAPATCSENAIAELRRPFLEVRSKTCPECLKAAGSRAAAAANG